MNINKAIKRIKKIADRKWYSIACKDDPDGVGPGSAEITSVGRQMHIRCGWYQIQGTRGYGTHRTPRETNRLIDALGRDRYSYSKMSLLEVRLSEKRYWVAFLE